MWVYIIIILIIISLVIYWLKMRGESGGAGEMQSSGLSESETQPLSSEPSISEPSVPESSSATPESGGPETPSQPSSETTEPSAGEENPM